MGTLKIGDFVCVNPRYTMEIDTVRGVVTTKTESFDSQYHVVDWEDGTTSSIWLSTHDDFLMLV